MGHFWVDFGELGTRFCPLFRQIFSGLSGGLVAGPGRVPWRRSNLARAAAWWPSLVAWWPGLAVFPGAPGGRRAVYRTGRRAWWPGLAAALNATK